jgi:acetylornithine/N-succinyldiaminopimelate aminotransferase
MKNNDYNTLFVNTFFRNGAPLVKGKGAYLFDAAGRKFLDFGTGIAVNAMGHTHAKIVKALREQGSKLLHVSNYYITPPQIEIARFLIRHSFGDRIFLCNSGTEANEGAIKFARKWAGQFSPDKYHILSFSDCFHGRTYGALSATSQKRFHMGFEPICPGFHYAPFNNIAGTKAILDKFKFAAIFIEPLQGEGGVNMVDKKFLSFLRKYADANRIALVFDEIQCGMGRTGALWCYEHYGITPDIMTIAKPVGGGLPLGAIICRNSVVECIKPGDHGTTFGGNPLACALGCVVLKEITKKSFLKGVEEKGAYLEAKLNALKLKFPVIQGIRGKGLILGARLNADPAPIVNKCKELGLLLIKAEHHTIRFLPPLNVTKKEIDMAFGIFENALNSLS